MEIILHFDEIFLKGKNKNFFIKKLSDNLNKIFPHTSTKRVEGGFIVKNITSEDLKKLALIPGIANFAEVQKCSNELSEIKKIINKIIFPNNIKNFRIKTSRSFKKYPLNSDEINREIGAFVCEKTGLKVNLKNPDFKIRVDIAKDCAYIYHNVIKGVGGLPVGSSGKVLCLISGGIDSPVAAYEVMKRGGEIDLIHFQNETLVKNEVQEKIFDLAKILNQYQKNLNLFIIPFGELQKEIVIKIPADHRMIIARRLMFKIAEKIARENNFIALASGDSLGQVASQTLENLQAIHGVSNFLKITPLITKNKSEITEIANKIGTYEISKKPYHDCCSYITGKFPQTKASLDNVLQLESFIDSTILDKIQPISYHIGIT